MSSDRDDPDLPLWRYPFSPQSDTPPPRPKRPVRADVRTTAKTEPKPQLPKEEPKPAVSLSLFSRGKDWYGRHPVAGFFISSFFLLLSATIGKGTHDYAAKVWSRFVESKVAEVTGYDPDGKFIREGKEKQRADPPPEPGSITKSAPEPQPKTAAPKRAPSKAPHAEQAQTKLPPWKKWFENTWEEIFGKKGG